MGNAYRITVKTEHTIELENITDWVDAVKIGMDKAQKIDVIEESINKKMWNFIHLEVKYKGEWIKLEFDNDKINKDYYNNE